MEKDLYQGRRRDPRKPRGLDKTAKVISPKEMTGKAVGVLNKSFDEAKDPREYGFEGEMVMSQLKGIMAHAKQLNVMLNPDTDLPEWVQSKITLAYDYMQTAADYMATEMNEEGSPTNTGGSGQVSGIIDEPGVSRKVRPMTKKPVKRFKDFTK
jgi:hypothetical protein